MDNISMSNWKFRYFILCSLKISILAQKQLSSKDLCTEILIMDIGGKR